MKVKLLRQNRIDGKKGDIVEVSPARARFLFEVKLAEPVLAREQVEVPEKKTATKKTTRAKK
jgi:ribosomal protein L9